MAKDRRLEIRPFDEAGRASIVALADRLTIGMAPWRDADACHAAVHRWVQASMNRSAGDGMLLVATASPGSVFGFISIEVVTHFSGEGEGYIGELVVDECAEGTGIGRMLVARAERWAREQGFRILTLETGAANERARGFYNRLGFREEGVRLTKVLDGPSETAAGAASVLRDR